MIDVLSVARVLTTFSKTLNWGAMFAKEDKVRKMKNETTKACAVYHTKNIKLFEL